MSEEKEKLTSMESPEEVKNVIHLIMQYLGDEKYNESLHMLEQESGLFFDMRHLEKLILDGKWNEIEKYLSGFTKPGDNRYSLKIYFEIRKQNYLEALDNHDLNKAADILHKDLADFHEFKELAHLLTLKNFSENEKLATARGSLATEVENLVKANPLLCDKLNFPAKLNTLIGMSSENSNEPIDAQSSATNNNQLVLASPPPPGPQPSFLANGNFQPLPKQVLTASTSAAPPPNVGPNLALSLAIPGATGAWQRALSNWANEFPRRVSRVLTLRSAPTCMDFHPIDQTLILVGTDAGEINLCEASYGVELRTSQTSQIGIVNNQSISVKRVLWNADGNVFGAAFSKNKLQLYCYNGRNKIRKHLECDAHDGSVNDLAFSSHTKKLFVITCGDDKLVKVWDVALGSMLYVCEGHSSPVSSVCPSRKNNINFFFSTSVDGIIKTWLYDYGQIPSSDETPDRACTELTYSGDGKRLFSCGTSNEGEAHVLERNVANVTVMRSYQGFRKNCVSPIQFGIAKNRFLAAGDDHSIKIWDIDNATILVAIDADGDLPARPRIRFNKEGSLLAVSANGNKIKILATVDKNRPFVPAKPPEKEANATRAGKVPEITQPSQLRSLRLTTLPYVEKISRLLFTHSGDGILALASNGINLFWKWTRANQEPTAKVTPRLWNIMTNDLTNVVKPEDAPCCFALSKNDSDLLSASGSKITHFAVNDNIFQIQKRFMPPLVATCLAFHPKDNGVIAIGFENSIIHIYNFATNELKKVLKGHSERITGLAFSDFLQTLISAGADSQIVRWNSESWVIEANSYLNSEATTSNNEVQFHINQTHFLVANQVQVSIHEPTKLELTKQWVAEALELPISQATFSADCQVVYALFLDGSIFVFDACALLPRCLIRPSAYFPANVTSDGVGVVFAKAVAAHPKLRNVVAVGLSDGRVVLLEPRKSKTNWGEFVPLG